jgi:hypothetical protein
MLAIALTQGFVYNEQMRCGPCAASATSMENRIEKGCHVRRSIAFMVSLSVVTAVYQVPVGARDSRAPSKNLHMAAMDGDVEELRLHIARGDDVNVKDSGGGSPLCYAAEYATAEAVKVLLEAGAQVNFKGAGDRPPLMGAARVGNKEIVDLLIAAGADVNAKDVQQMTALHLAAEGGHREVAQALIKAGANVNAEDAMRKTPLMLATSRSQSEMVEFLKQQGAKEPVAVNPDAPYGEYGTPYAEGQVMAPAVQEAVPEVVIDPNAIRLEIGAFAGLAEAIKVVDDKSTSEQRGWMQRRLDNRTILIRAGERQFNEELAFVKKTATDEKAAKTITAIDELAARRKTRCDDVYKELLEERRAAIQEQRDTTGMSRGRTAMRGRTSSRGIVEQGGNPYETSTGRTPTRGMQAEPNEPPIDPITQVQIDAWLGGTPESKDALLEAVHKQDQVDLDALRTVATDEKAKKTAATLSGLMLARELRIQKIRQQWVEEDERMQKLQERMGPEGVTRGRTTRGPAQQTDQTNTRGRRYR